MVRALVIGIKTEVYIQPAVAIVISDSRPSESSLRRIGEFECIALLAEFPAALVQKQHRPSCPNNDHILAAVVVEIGKQCASRVLQNTEAR